MGRAILACSAMLMTVAVPQGPLPAHAGPSAAVTSSTLPMTPTPAALPITPASPALPTVPPASTGPVLTPVVPVPVSPVSVQRSLSRQLRDVPSGVTVSGIVIDTATDGVVGQVAPDLPLEPASTLKLLTAIAVLRRLGPGATFTTSVVQVKDHLVLTGTGDPTLVTTTPRTWRGKPPGVAAPASIEQLAAQVAAAVTPGPWVVDVDAGYFAGQEVSPTWPANYVRGGYVQPVTGLALDVGKAGAGRREPARTALTALAAALRARGLDVTAGEAVGKAEVGTVVASVESTPLAGIVERMLTTSNNTFAEYLARYLAPQAGTFDAAGAAVSRVAGEAGVELRTTVLRDGSGLSSADRTTVRTLVSALQIAARGAGSSWVVLSALPIAGVSGTLDSRYPGAGRGYVRAKTGTLHGVVSLAGTVATADGNVLLFAFIANGVRSAPALQHTLDVTAAALAQCGCG